MRKEIGLLEADINITRVASARRAFDVAGHYSRPDIFTLRVDARPQSPLEFSR